MRSVNGLFYRSERMNSVCVGIVARPFTWASLSTGLSVFCVHSIWPRTDFHIDLYNTLLNISLLEVIQWLHCAQTERSAGCDEALWHEGGGVISIRSLCKLTTLFDQNKNTLWRDRRGKVGQNKWDVVTEWPLIVVCVYLITGVFFCQKLAHKLLLTGDSKPAAYVHVYVCV